ncbi:MAG: hypothetical protein PSV17_05280 [Methylotenera sp.]|uniref:hypothetical protein n=1 Tax=Methylotenera sp. TaxID=2051956 RepID=UPI00248A853D|nr:hypothetical protein [Methylotenera sp.]MDI1308834.1 hypothetical protein [Methylotenera sp.]
MKLNLIVLALAISSQSALAYQCNTVMGGCPTDTSVATSTHMRSDLGVKVAPPAKAAVAPSKTGGTGSTGTAAKLPAKK